MKNVFHLGKLKIDAAAYGSQGNAILGIRDSGKTYTATEIAEKLFEAGVPFITFDPTGVWRWLRNPGKGRGYPIVVVGGKYGDLPLVAAHAAEIVRAAMKNGVSMVIDLTDDKLSKADWRRIVKSCVTVMLQENAQHGLRHIFIEEAAEFCPQKVIDGDVYAVIERLARIGGNSRLGYTLVNQRSQEVNKAVLELCENLFLHRQKGKNAIQSLDHWLDVAGVDDQKALVKSLPGLPSGHCWAWMGGNEKPLLIQVPPKNSFHPDRRVMHGAKAKGAKKPVNVGSFVKDMKAALVTLQAEFEANDLGELKKKVAALTAENTKLKNEAHPASPRNTELDRKAIEIAEQSGFEQAKKKLTAAMEKQIKTAQREFIDAIKIKLKPVLNLLDTEARIVKHLDPELGKAITFESSAVAPATPKTIAVSSAPLPKAIPVDGLKGPEQRILNALATWLSMGHEAPSNAQVAWLAGYSPSSSSYTNPRGALKSRELVSYPHPDRLSITPAGRALATQIELSGRKLIDFVSGQLRGPEQRILLAIAAAHPNPITNEQAAEGAGYSPASSSYANPRGALRSKELITYPQPNHVQAADWLFQEVA